MNENPVPTNITKPRKLDEYYKEVLEENRAKRELTLDGTLEKIQLNIEDEKLNIMGPMRPSKLWFRFEEALPQDNSMVQLYLNELTQYLEQPVMLVSQAFNVITYNQRLNILSAVQDKRKPKYKR